MYYMSNLADNAAYGCVGVVVDVNVSANVADCYQQR